MNDRSTRQKRVHIIIIVITRLPREADGLIIRFLVLYDRDLI